MSSQRLAKFALVKSCRNSTALTIDSWGSFLLSAVASDSNRASGRELQMCPRDTSPRAFSRPWLP
ncbi:hypothetical protein CH63R_11911 [Colletotrichum higginsianum IMI 349063]|uniref:Uncharacterized protein n=1 Tax=Colletotrichum higginsianum (strain IMI 349063) TaxID=759273 RepID=A0A1B7XZL0_COLHI|nr:hypothetical protein CH63R_11911 [Colletotrichum higginsianum IMI 349063]OBR05208.1 hypothetical protein CH63R_11911 [Colletotrichum higginsianum IMI 349063]